MMHAKPDAGFVDHESADDSRARFARHCAREQKNGTAIHQCIPHVIEAVVEAGVGHDDIVGQLEPALEIALGQAAMTAASPAAFSIQCPAGVPQAFGQSASPATARTPPAAP